MSPCDNPLYMRAGKDTADTCTSARYDEAKCCKSDEEGLLSFSDHRSPHNTPSHPLPITTLMPHPPAMPHSIQPSDYEVPVPSPNSRGPTISPRPPLPRDVSDYEVPIPSPNLRGPTLPHVQLPLPRAASDYEVPMSSPNLRGPTILSRPPLPEAASDYEVPLSSPNSRGATALLEQTPWSIQASAYEVPQPRPLNPRGQNMLNIYEEPTKPTRPVAKLHRRAK